MDTSPCRDTDIFNSTLTKPTAIPWYQGYRSTFLFMLDCRRDQNPFIIAVILGKHQNQDQDLQPHRMGPGQHPNLKGNIVGLVHDHSNSIANAHSLANRLETVRVSHWLIAWLIYLSCTMSQGQSHCASNIISNSHLFHSKWVNPPIPELQQFKYFYLVNPKSRSWVRSKIEVTMWVLHSIDSHPFRSMPISNPIPEIRLFKNWTLKIQGQGHGRVERWQSQHDSNIFSRNIPFIPCQSAIPFLRYDLFKIWPWKSKVKVMV